MYGTAESFCVALMYKIPNFKPYFGDKERKYVDDALGARLSPDPRFVDLFEKSFAQYVGRKYAIAVSSGTAGLHLLVKYAVEKNGSGSIITTPLTFVASANVILYERQKVIFSDIGENLLLDEGKIKCLLEEKEDIAAVIYVDIFGSVPNSKRVKDACDQHGIFLIEDASQAIGSRNGEVVAGQVGHGSVFSFNKNKQITSGGEGGMIVTDDEDVYNFCLSMRDQCRVNGENWIDSARVGYNYRMTEIQAAVGCAQLEKIDSFLEKRRELVSMYGDMLRGLQHVVVAPGTDDACRSWFIFYILVDDAILREKIIRTFSKSGIECKTNYFPPVYKFKAYKETDFISLSAEKFYAEVVALPLYVEMTKDDVATISRIIINCCKE